MDVLECRFYPSGVLSFPGGRKYQIEQGRVAWMQDRNGNRMQFAYNGGSYSGPTTITDSLNRQITISYKNTGAGGTYYDLITYKVGLDSFNNPVYRSVRVNFAPLTQCLATGYSSQTYRQLFPELDNYAQTYSRLAVSSVELPNGRSFIVRYTSHGEIAELTLPTGGKIAWTYAAGLKEWALSGFLALQSTCVADPTQYACHNLYSPLHIYRRLISRIAYKSDGMVESRTDYSRPENMGTNNIAQYCSYVEVQNKKPDN